MENLQEEWKDVPIEYYANAYKVSSFGDIYSNFSKKNRKIEAKKGYQKISLNHKAKSRTFRVHVLVALAFLPNPDNLYVVHHIDHNKTNNKASNLKWTTDKGNVGYAREFGAITDEGKKVIRYEKDGTTTTYKSISEAARQNYVDRNEIYKSIYKEVEIDDCIYDYKDEYHKLRFEEPKDARQLPEYPTYLITSDGKIYNRKKMKYRTLSSKYTYQSVDLWNGKDKGKFKCVHILVATLFVINPDPVNKTVVNHRDGNTFNNNYRNLEWVTRSENNKHAAKLGLSKTRPVAKLDQYGNTIQIYSSTSEAAIDNNINCDSLIWRVCNGIRITTGGHYWCYYNGPIDRPKSVSMTPDSPDMPNIISTPPVPILDKSIRGIQNSEYIPMAQIDITTNEIVGVAINSKRAATVLNKTDDSHIRKTRDKDNRTAYGYKWISISQEEYGRYEKERPELLNLKKQEPKIVKTKKINIKK